MEEVRIPYCDLSTQRRIAARLERADHLRRMRRYALQMCDELLPTGFLEMFGDPGRNPHSFPVLRGEELFDTRRGGAKCGPFGSASKNYEYVLSGIPVWTMENVQANSFTEEGSLYITPDKFQKLKAYEVHDGDILISRAGTVGRMAIVRTRYEHSIMHSNLIRLALDNTQVLPEYYVILMTWFGPRIAKLKTGQRMPIHL
jgi:type I restriction enzyme S subunit